MYVPSEAEFQCANCERQDEEFRMCQTSDILPYLGREILGVALINEPKCD